MSVKALRLARMTKSSTIVSMARGVRSTWPLPPRYGIFPPGEAEQLMPATIFSNRVYPNFSLCYLSSSLNYTLYLITI